MAKRPVKENTSGIVFHLDEMMKKRSINKHQLQIATGASFDTIDRFCKGTITLLSVYTLSAFCRALRCDLSDIIEYADPPK